jgi:hypothetical protein
MKKFYILLSSLLLTVSVGFSQSAVTRTELLPQKSSRDSRFAVQATVMGNDTWCHVSWPDPYNYYDELVYDDGNAEDYFLWSGAGGMNANKFHPPGYPFILAGGSIYVGDSTFPGPFLGTSFRVFVYDDDGENGLPGTALDSIDVTVNNYQWVEFEGFTLTITEGDFYLAMEQLAPAPLAAPVGVDYENPTYFVSYVYMPEDQQWVLSPLQDFMIRAWIVGFLEPSRNIDYFQLARFSNFNPNGSPQLGDTTVLPDTIYNSEYDDYAWDALPAGNYAYGIKTHFTGGEWSDYDVSNIVTHIMNCFIPSCFYQADTGNRPLIICPPVDSTGSVPFNFIGYNLYLNGYFLAFLPPSTTSYDPDLPLPVKTFCDLTCVYDLAPYGYPGETGESFGLTTEYLMRWGYPLPFVEPWNSGTFETNAWVTDAPNWTVSGQQGNPLPSAEFSSEPIIAHYESSLTSYPYLADSMTAGKIYLDFDIRLNSTDPSGSEFLIVQVRNWESMTWVNADTFSNITGGFGWIADHLDITTTAMNQVFNIRFLTLGEYSAFISGWFIDNINVYRSCNPPQNFSAAWTIPNQDMELYWESPEGASLCDQWIYWHDAVNYANSFGTGSEFSVAARWTPDLLTGFEGGLVTKIAFFPKEPEAIYKVRVWQGEDAANLVVDQQVNSPLIGQWNTITLETPAELDVTQELWVGYYIDSDSGYPAGGDNGPAVDGYGNMIYQGQWQTLLEVNPGLDYNWNIKAYIDLPDGFENTVEYAVYRSDDSNPFYLRDVTFQNFYLDDSAFCYLPGEFHIFKISAIYSGETESCESVFSNMIGEICEGISDEIRPGSLSLFPNPCNDFLRIESSERLGLISIYNSFGELILKKKVDEKQIEIPVSDYSAGVYLIRVDAGGCVISKKVIVVH